jgi:DNA-binding HxlR family transcriptional regulator
MQRTRFNEMACSLARTLDVAGEPWTPLILRDLWLRRTRFDEIQANLGLSRKLLTDRLETLVREGAVERRAYQDRPARYEYVLTDRGEELVEGFLVLISWGDRWRSEEAGPPWLMRHKSCGENVAAEVRCSCCGERLHARDVRLEPGPGAEDGWGTRPHPRAKLSAAGRSPAPRSGDAAAPHARVA